MNPAKIPSRPVAGARRKWARLSTGVLLLGFLTALLLLRRLPPAPAFSPQLGRANYWQSYESSYFATVRAYEAPIQAILAAGNIPVVVFGDSSIRGAGASGADVWTRCLERRLQAVEPRVRVLNYAQNAGDMMGPLLYHHLQKKFPAIHCLVQWHFASEVGARHPFHYWLTSEIAWRDGKQNPAVQRSFRIVPVSAPEERAAFVLAGLNLVTNYLDVGNWIRYRWLGRPFFGSDRKPGVQPLRDVAESDVAVPGFTPPDAGQARAMRDIFSAHLPAYEAYLQRPLAERAAYFAEIFPARVRSHLLLFTLDFNPYYAPREDEAKMKSWRDSWKRLRADMAQIPDLRWLSLSGSQGETGVNDFMDLGHLTPPGQRRLADAVAEKLLASDGWFAPEAPGEK